VKSALAIEIITAAQGIDQRAPLTPAKGVAAAHAVVRAEIPTLLEDRPLYRDIAKARTLIETEAIARGVQAAIGDLF
jgi:histidine ammonia-lyase